jgi:hypothetical protein
MDESFARRNALVGSFIVATVQQARGLRLPQREERQKIEIHAPQCHVFRALHLRLSGPAVVIDEAEFVSEPVHFKQEIALVKIWPAMEER